MALAQDHLDAFAVCYTKAVDRLYRVSVSCFSCLESVQIFLVGHPTRVLGNICLLQSSHSVVTSEAPTTFTVLSSNRCVPISRTEHVTQQDLQRIPLFAMR